MKLTTKQVASLIRQNVDEFERRRDFADFSQVQYALWDYARERSERFTDAVARQVMPAWPGLK